MSKAYPSNLTENQFELLKDLIPAPKPGGRPREVEMWGVLNAIFVCPVRGLSLAGATRRLPQLANGLYLLSALAS